MNTHGYIGRWNWATHQYDPYTPNPTWNLVLYTEDMDLAINCANCGKTMTYGEGLTSREIHNATGFGYPVCSSCYEDEFKREREARA
jgi:hypothetical protein